MLRNEEECITENKITVEGAKWGKVNACDAEKRLTLEPTNLREETIGYYLNSTSEAHKEKRNKKEEKGNSASDARNKVVKNLQSISSSIKITQEELSEEGINNNSNSNAVEVEGALSSNGILEEILDKGF